MNPQQLPDYASSLMSAEKNLKACWDSIVDEQDLVAALTHANTARLAVDLLMIDLELRLRDTKPRKCKTPEPKVEVVEAEPPKRRESCKPDDVLVAAWVREQYGESFIGGSELQQRGWRAGYVIAQRKKQEERA